MTKQDIAQFQEDQLNKLRYMKDIRDVMKAKPQMESAPKSAKGFALNLNDGDNFGTWEWLTVTKAPVGYVYFEPVERIPEDI